MIKSMTSFDCRVAGDEISYSPSGGCRGITNGHTFFLLDHWTLNSVHVHMKVVPGHMSPHFCREVFRYIFVSCARGLAIGSTPAHNAQALRFSSAMGFEPKYRIQDGWAIGEDLVISELRKENCKFLRKVHEQRRSSPA